jgi:hypothetical protein
MCEVRRETDGRNTLQIVMRLWRGHWVGVVEDQSRTIPTTETSKILSSQVGIPMLECDVSISSPLDQDPYLWSKDRSEQVVTTFPIDLTQSIKQERRRMWCTLLRCSSSLLQSLGLISKLLNATEVLQRLEKELFLLLYMII